MRLLVVGCGQCGGRLADEFARLSVRARTRRGINIITDCLAVNTDMADLAGLYAIKRDYRHRIVIGNQRTGGHGVGKLNELGAEVAREDGDKLLEAIRETEGLAETDAFLLTSSAGGGTGSGTVAVLTQYLKTAYPEKPIYNLLVLPFKHEETTEGRIVYNTGTCLKSAFLVADAIFLVDNQRFVRKNQSLRTNLHKINAMVVAPFYNMLCAGEEVRPEYVGSRVLDAGDIIQTLSGWTAIGHGAVQRPMFSFFDHRDRHSSDFREKAAQSHEELRAMHMALSELSLKCNPTDAHRALYLLCAPPEKMNMDLVQELSNAMKNVARDAVIRAGDYPRRKRSTDVTVVLSELRNVARINEIFSQVIAYISSKKKQRGIMAEHQQFEDAFRDIPTLF